MLSLLRKYTAHLAAVGSMMEATEPPTLTPIIWADPPLADMLSQLKIFLSRVAANSSLNPSLEALYASVHDLVNLPIEAFSDSRSHRQVKDLLEDLGAWLEAALYDGRFAMSVESSKDLEDLYDRAYTLVEEASHSDARWLRHLRDLLHEVDTLSTAIAQDGATSRLFRALTALSSSFSAYMRDVVASGPARLASAQRRVRDDLKRDILTWLLPRLLIAIHAVPMPRVEYRSKSMDLDAAVDALYITPSSAQASLVPDHIRVWNTSKIQLSVDETDILDGMQPLVPSYTIYELAPGCSFMWAGSGSVQETWVTTFCGAPTVHRACAGSATKTRAWLVST